MKNRALGFASLTLAALLCVALPAFGQTSMQFVSSTSEYGDPFGSAQTGLYGAVINGTSTLMVCDDFNHEITDGETWTANGVNAASLTSTTGLQFAGIGLYGYTELAYVVNQMFTTSPSSAQRSIFSQVLWAITGGITSAQLSPAALTLYNYVTTTSLPSLSTYTNLWIYTPTDQTLGGPQEMWAVPEGGAALMYVLLAGVSCFGAMFFRSRRQNANPGIA